MASKSASGCSVAQSIFRPYLFLHFTSLSNSHLITKSLTVTTGWFSNWFALSARPLGNSYTVRTFPMGLVCNLTLFWHIFKGGPRKKNTVYNYILSVASIRWYTESLTLNLVKAGFVRNDASFSNLGVLQLGSVANLYWSNWDGCDGWWQ